VLEALCKWLDIHGTLDTLRHGFKCFGRTLRIAFFRPAHGLNPDLEARYQANRLGLTRQLHFSPRSEQSLDVALSVNGIPVLSLELKNPLSGQTVADAIRQYRHDRDPREPIFAFTQRTLVHFAVDTEEAHMTTRLAGSATNFLPFNRGLDGAAGNPPDPEGRNYKTAYLWEEVLQRDSLLDLLARFLHLSVEEKVTDDGKKVRKEGLIFPRYHQLQAVRQMVAAAASEGVGHNYLVEHSAGSGKSNTIAWLAHRLSSLHNARMSACLIAWWSSLTGWCWTASCRTPSTSLITARAWYRRSTRIRANWPRPWKRVCRSLSPRCRSFPSFPVSWKR
jgi:type I restriction enzyme R subunit